MSTEYRSDSQSFEQFVQAIWHHAGSTDRRPHWWRIIWCRLIWPGMTRMVWV